MSVFDENSVLHILNYLGKVSLKTFNERMRLQKQAYLAQELGCNSGFSFIWYVRGPYSPSLTKFLYSADEVGELINQEKLSAQENAIVDNMKLLLGNQINSPLPLELYASVWYHLPDHLMQEDEFEEMLDFLNESKPHFAREQISNAANHIIDFRQRLNL
jgi:hypothetical protein